MILYYKSNNDFNLQIKDILKDLDNQLNIHEAKSKVLSKCLENIDTITKNNSQNTDSIAKLSKLSGDIQSGLEKLSKNKSDLENLKSFLNSSSSELPNKFNYRNKKLMSMVKQYNKLAIDSKNNIYSTLIDIDSIILEYSNLSVPAISKALQSNEPKVESNDTNVVDNNVLLISEVQNKVVLPYTLSDLKKTLNSNSKYNSLQDVIENEYTFPLDEYKNPRIARFKEAFSLMRKKEKSSMVDSLDLAFELSFNRLLNPAIIAACKNLDELDVYLDCLSSNELDKFNLFKIKYEIFPK